MQLRYGNAFFPVGQVECLPRLQAVRNDAGDVLESVWTVAVRGDLLASDPGGPNAAQELGNLSALFRLALQRRDADLVLLDDQGRATDVTLRYAGTVGGVQVDVVRYPDDEPGALVTRRGFEFVARAAYPNALPGLLVEYQESIARTGTGGPNVIFQPALETPPVAVAVQRFTVCRTVVAGRAVGHRGYPPVPPPPWSGPGVVLKNPATAVSYGSPRFRGRGYTDYPVEWRYEFESPFVLVGLPRVWGGRRQ